MKKWLIRVFLITMCIMVSAFFLTACSGSEKDDGDNDNGGEVVTPGGDNGDGEVTVTTKEGTYKLNSIVMTGQGVSQTITVGTSIPGGETLTENFMVFVLKADSTYVCIVEEEILSGTWSVDAEDASKLTLSSLSEMFEITFASGKLTLKVEVSGMSQSYILNKVSNSTDSSGLADLLPDDGNGDSEGVSPEKPGQGGDNVTPEQPGEGGGDNVTPEQPGQGGDNVTPEQPGQGGDNVTPEQPGQGGGDNVTPEQPGQGGDNVTPEQPGQGGSEDNPPVQEEESVVGIYKFVYTTEDGETYCVGDEIPGLGVLTENFYIIELRADGVMTVSSEMFGESYETVGTWEAGEEENSYTLVADGDGVTAYIIDGRLSWTTGSSEIVLAKDGIVVVPPPGQGGGEVNPPVQEEESVVGTYKFSYITLEMDGSTETVRAGDEIMGEVITEDYFVIIVKGDGTFVFAEEGYVGEGTWVKSDDGENLYEYTVNGYTEFITISDGELVMTQGEAPRTQTMVLVKTSNSTDSDWLEGINPPVQEEESVVGVYKFVSMTQGELSYSVGQEYGGIILTEDFMVFELLEDGVLEYSLEVAGEIARFDGTWEAEDEENAYILYIEGEIFTAYIIDGRLTIDIEVEGYHVSYVLVKDGNADVNPPVEDEEEELTPEAEAKLGTYKFTDITISMGGTTETFEIGDEPEPGYVLTEDFMVLVLKPDYSYVGLVEDSAHTGKWRVDKQDSSKIVFKDMENLGATMTITIVDDALSIYMDGGQDGYVEFNLTKFSDSTDSEWLEEFLPKDDIDISPNFNVEGTYVMQRLDMEAEGVKLSYGIGDVIPGSEITITEGFMVIELKEHGELVTTSDMADGEEVQGTWTQVGQYEYELNINGEISVVEISSDIMTWIVEESEDLKVSYVLRNIGIAIEDIPVDDKLDYEVEDEFFE